MIDDDDFVDAEEILNVPAQDKPTGKSNQITITHAKPEIQRTAERQGAGSLMVQGPKPAGAISCMPPNLVAKQVSNGVDHPPAELKTHLQPAGVSFGEVLRPTQLQLGAASSDTALSAVIRPMHDTYRRERTGGETSPDVLRERCCGSETPAGASAQALISLSIPKTASQLYSYTRTWKRKPIVALTRTFRRFVGVTWGPNP